jgi:hypothetical protein
MMLAQQLKIDSDNVLEVWYRLCGLCNMLLLLSRLSLENLKHETWLDRRTWSTSRAIRFLDDLHVFLDFVQRQLQLGRSKN